VNSQGAKAYFDQAKGAPRLLSFSFSPAPGKRATGIAEMSENARIAAAGGNQYFGRVYWLDGGQVVDFFFGPAADWREIVEKVKAWVAARGGKTFGERVPVFCLEPTKLQPPTSEINESLPPGYTPGIGITRRPPEADTNEDGTPGGVPREEGGEMGAPRIDKEALYKQLEDIMTEHRGHENRTSSANLVVALERRGIRICVASLGVMLRGRPKAVLPGLAITTKGVYMPEDKYPKPPAEPLKHGEPPKGDGPRVPLEPLPAGDIKSEVGYSEPKGHLLPPCNPPKYFKLTITAGNFNHEQFIDDDGVRRVMAAALARLTYVPDEPEAKQAS
jgi:hypothetical protein